MKPLTIIFTVTTDDNGDIVVTVQQQPRPKLTTKQPAKPKTYRPYKVMFDPKRTRPKDHGNGNGWHTDRN